MRALICIFLAAAAVLDAAPPRPRWRHLSSASGDLPSPGPSDQQTGSLIADVNGDGVNDFFVVTRVVGPAVTLFEKTPDGWRRHVVEPDFIRIEAGGAAHDIDGDGDTDIVFGNDGSGIGMWWWENPYPDLDPAKRWPRHVIKSSGGEKHHDQMFGDFDDDGRIELMAWNQRGNALLLFEIPDDPRGDSEWPSRKIYEWEGEEHEGLTAADVDQDGTVDLIGGGRWFKHTGGGKFEPRSIDDRFRFSRAAAGQLVEGGAPEIAFAPGDVDGPIQWFEQRDGEWVGHPLPIPDLVHGHSIGVGDVNGDGHDDIFSAEMGQWGSQEGRNNPGARMRVFYGDGTGRFFEQVVAKGFGNHESRIADLDGDGDLDILGKPYNWKTPRIDVWINETPQEKTLSLDQWQRHVIDAEKPWRAVFIYPADLNGDGKRDIVAGGWWYENPGTLDEDWTRRDLGEPLKNVAVVHDFDDDGDLDVLGTEGESSSFNPKFVWAENDGSGSFRIRRNIPRGDGDFLQGAAVGRFHPDHRRPSVALSWHLADRGVQLLTVPEKPAEQEWSWTRISELSQDEGMAAADIDRDGDADLLLGTYWLENEGGEFQAHQLNPADGLPDRNVLADIDGDGRLDGVSGFESSRAPGKLAWYEQAPVATATWTEHLIDRTIGPMSMDVADLDRDGDVDVLVGQHNLVDPSASKLLIYENVDGRGGEWSSREISSGDEHHDGTQLADMDGDGDLDIISLGWTHGRVLIFENRAVIR